VNFSFPLMSVASFISMFFLCFSCYLSMISLCFLSKGPVNFLFLFCFPLFSLIVCKSHHHRICILEFAKKKQKKKGTNLTLHDSRTCRFMAEPSLQSSPILDQLLPNPISAQRLSPVRSTPAPLQSPMFSGSSVAN